MIQNRKLALHNRKEKILKELVRMNEQLEDQFRLAKMEKMRVSPYTFFRGSNHLYWEDFYNDWRFSIYGGRVDTLTWINGDAHIYNYGAYANHYGQALFGMDDFDDSTIADYQYDLWRMAISIVLDCRDLKVFAHEQQATALERFSHAYLTEITAYEEDDIHREVMFTKDNTSGLLRFFLEKVEEKRSRKKMLKKWTEKADGIRRFNYGNGKLEKLDEHTFQAFNSVMSSYAENLALRHNKGQNSFQIRDIAKRLGSGTGSLGCDRFYVLLAADSSTHHEDIILDVKEQNKPPLYNHMSKREQKAYDTLFLHEGERFVEAFSALAEHPDKYLGWLTFNNKVFSVRERSPFKSDFPTEELKSEEDLYQMAEVWGKLLAIHHERASHKLNNDPYTLPKVMKRICESKEAHFTGMVKEIAFNYATCVEQDWKVFVEEFGS